MPCMLVSSDAVAPGPVSADQSSYGVWARLAPSGEICGRWYLVWYWLTVNVHGWRTYRPTCEIQMRSGPRHWPVPGRPAHPGLAGLTGRRREDRHGAGPSADHARFRSGGCGRAPGWRPESPGHDGGPVPNRAGHVDGTPEGAEVPCSRSGRDCVILAARPLRRTVTTPAGIMR
jgi:hypothetical protein